MQAGRQRWRLWAGVGIITWAAALQTHMWYLQSTEEFKRKFPEIAEGKPKESVEAETEELRSWSVRLKSSAQE